MSRSPFSYENLKAEATRRGIDWRPPETRQSDFARYRADPVAFAREVLHIEPWERQCEIMQAVADHPRVTVRSCVNSGKSWAAAALTIWRVYCFNPSLVITTATTDRQVKGILWHEIGQMHRRAELPGRILGQELYASPTQRAMGFTTNTPERFQGWHEEWIMGIVDEAAGVPNPIYEALEGMMASHHPKQLFIGNPNVAAGAFYESFKSPLYQQFKISAFDVPEKILPAKLAEDALLLWGEDSPAYQVRVLGEFPDQGEDSLISMRWVTEAQGRTFDDTEASIELGVDIARFGSDESVAYRRRGQTALGADYWRGNDTMQSVGRIIKAYRRYGVSSVKVDEIGVGAGVLDRLKEQGIKAEGVNVGEAAWDSEHFANRRAEIFWGLRERFRTGDIAIPADDTTLLAQLTSLRFSYTSRGQIKLESKEDMRKRGLPSPDRADALAITFASGRPFALPGASAGPSKGMSGSPLASMGGR